MRMMKREMRMIQKGKQEAGKVDTVGNVGGLGKSRGTQERISLELEMRTNINHSKGINTCALSLI